MAETVFILGAGASKNSGAPLMKGFLDVTEKCLLNDEFGDENEDLYKIFRKIRHLQDVHSKSYLDLDNIETVFGAIEMSKIISRLPRCDSKDIPKIRNGLIKLIVRTLENEMLFPSEISTPLEIKILPSPEYEEFAKNLKDFKDPAIITFNYDIGLEIGLHSAFKINYCLSEEEKDGLKVLKLHGSTNWGTSSKNNTIIPYHIPKFLEDANDDLMKLRVKNEEQGKKNIIPLHVSDYLPKSGDINSELSPVIIPPAWTKSEYHSVISNVWTQAANELKDARNIYIIGFSLSVTDSFIRYLYALGTISTSTIQRFWIFNPDVSDKIISRYVDMVGPSVKDRLRYYPWKFDRFSNHQNALAPESDHFVSFFEDCAYWQKEKGWGRIRDIDLRAGLTFDQMAIIKGNYDGI